MGRMLLLGACWTNHPVLLLQQFKLIVAEFPFLESSTEGSNVDYTNLKNKTKQIKQICLNTIGQSKFEKNINNKTLKKLHAYTM